MKNSFTDSAGDILLEKTSTGLASIIYSHPKHNIFPSKQLYALAELIRHLNQEENVKVIRLKTAGEETFCAGASFDELLSLSSEAEAEYFFSGFAAIINAIRTCSKLVITQVQGRAIGGGLGLAAAADYCFASTEAHIRLSELAIGLGPFVIAPAVERKIGLSALTLLTLNPQKYKPAEWALEKGLYQELLPSLDALEEATLDFAARLCSYSSLALQELKKMFWRGTQDWETLLPERARISGKLVLSQETKQNLKQFKNK